jgi:general secretion pathway protein J
MLDVRSSLCSRPLSPTLSPRTGRESRGFTLLELLLAMSMAAMLALSLYTAMRVTLKSRDSANAAVDPVRTASIAMDMIQQDFESVPPPPPSDASTNVLGGPFYATHQPAGRGDNDTIEFYSLGADPVVGDPTEASPLAEGVRKIEFYVSTDTPSPTLVRRVTRNLLPASEATYDEEILCRDVRSFSLRYYDGTAWQEDWDSSTLDDSLPNAVAITLELGNVSADKPSQRITRVVPLACAKPLTSGSTTVTGGAP